MKIVVIGDIHGRDTWKKIVNDNKDADKIVILGDYMDSFTIDTEVQLLNLYDLILFKREQKDRLILLLGNHDFHYAFNWLVRNHTSPSYEKYSGYKRYTMEQCGELFVECLKRKEILLSWQYENLLFSHAGFSTPWLKEVAKTQNPGDLDWNSYSIEELQEYFGFSLADPRDIYGTNKYQGPLWIRPGTLVEYLPKGFIQIVGHTESRSPEIESFKPLLYLPLEEQTDTNLIICDRLPFSYLTIEDKVFKPTETGL